MNFYEGKEIDKMFYFYFAFMFLFAFLFASFFIFLNKTLDFRKKVNLLKITNLSILKDFFNMLEGSKNNYLYIHSRLFLKKTESTLSVREIYFLQFCTLIFSLVVYSSVSLTNFSIEKNGFIEQKIESLKNNVNIGTQVKSFNLETYSLIKESGATIRSEISKIFKTQDGSKKVTNVNYEKYKEVVKESFENRKISLSSDELDFVSSVFADIYNFQQNLINLDFFLIMLAFYFSPVIFLYLRRFILKSAFVMDIQKMEAIAQMLMEIKGIKTIDLLKELESVTLYYKKNISTCIENFQQDKELSLLDLKKSISNKRMSSLIDTIITFSLSDKTLANSILERNVKEQQDQALFLASEDLEQGNIICILSVIPIIYYAFMLMIEPLLPLMQLSL
jgi:hypothetical protein